MPPSTRVLLIGTTKDVQNTVRSQLLSIECEMISATSIALGVFLARKNFPELIICEPELTDGEGLMFLREIKQDAELAELPVVFLSTKLTDPSYANSVVASGAERLISCVDGWDSFLGAIKPYLARSNKIRTPETPE